MSDYNDSFEAESTSSDDVENTSVPAHSASSSHSERGAAARNADVQEQKDAPSASPRAGSPSFAPAAPLAVVVPVAAPAPLPVPLPVPVMATERAKETVQSLSKSEGSGSPSSLPLPKPRSRGGALTSPLPYDGVATERRAESSSGQSEGEVWRRSTQQSFGKLSNSDSAGLPREVAEAAARAGDGAEFQALSHFVAFGSERASSAYATTHTAQTSHRTSEVQVPPAPSRVPRQFVAFPASEDGSFVREPSRESPLMSPPDAPHAAQPAAESSQKTPSDTKSASVAPSSVFSTLSQHLQSAPPPQQQQPNSVKSTLPIPSQPTLPLPLAPSMAHLTSVPPAASVSLPMLAASSSPLAMSGVATATSPSKASATATPAPALAAAGEAATTAMTIPPLLALPSLPSPGWSATPSASTGAAHLPLPMNISIEAARADTAIVNGTAEGGVAPFRGSHGAAPAPTVAPLPSPPEYHRATAEEARVSELREASEAVERLVKAFAMLKGYGALEKDRAGQLPAAKAMVSAATTTAHRAGAFSTVQARPASRIRGPRVPSAHVDAANAEAGRQSAKAAASSVVRRGGFPIDGERLAEDLVLDCVLGLLREHAEPMRKHRGDGGEEGRGDDSAVPWRGARPHYEVVSADSFAASNGYNGGAGGLARPRTTTDTSTRAAASAARVYANPSTVDGVPGIDVPLFDPRDRQSAADLYNVARDALEKYVLRRIRTSETSPSRPTPTTTPLRVTHITAPFAWALLLDMSSVCQEIARCAYDASAASPSAVYPILVQFKGDAACGEVARSAMHCLPFEAISPTESSEATASAHKCLFRMACWVTQEQLWTVSDALMDAVREDVVKRAKAIQYSPFATAAPAEVDARLLVPPEVPMFTMLPLPSRRVHSPSPAAPPANRSSDGPYAYSKVSRIPTDSAPAASAADRDLFDVPAAALQRVAYNISALSTTILSSAGPDSILDDLRAEEYGDVATAVSETIDELLQDESIKAAVQRRSAEKVKKAQMARTGYASATRQRKEQAIIDKAEREAEEMVQHILQEMRAQKVSS